MLDVSYKASQTRLTTDIFTTSSIMNTSLAIIIIGLYAIATYCIFRDSRVAKKNIGVSERNQPSKTNASWLVGLFNMPTAIVGVSLHFWLAAQTSYVQHSFNFSVASMTLWISALVVFIYLVGTCIHPIKSLGLVTLPVAIFNIAFAVIWGDNITLIQHQTPVFFWHIGLSIAGFTVLALSVLQSLMFALQEFGLKQKRFQMVGNLLPPIQTMERVLFELIWLGFVLLSIAIILGGVYNYQTQGSLFSFNHHNLLALLSWFIFMVLLYGRNIKGWRGIQTVKWTVGAFVLLNLGYFGSKLVSEVLA